MEFIVVIDRASAFGTLSLEMLRKIGGANLTTTIAGVVHPTIICKDLDWSVPGLLQATHLQDAGDPDQKPIRIALPSSTVLFAVEARKVAAANTDTEQAPTILH